MDLLNTPIGDIAREHPSSTRVFLRHRLDFCCGGRRTLREACTKAGLDPEQVARELAAEEKACPGARWDVLPSTELVDHIVARYHDQLRHDLPALIAAAQAVERVHAGKPLVPRGLADELDELWLDLQQHMVKEERVLFPMLSAGLRGAQVYMPIRVMEQEHAAHAAHLSRIRELTKDLEIPEHACSTWTALYRGLRSLEVELVEHIHLENNVLFPRAGKGG